MPTRRKFLQATAATVAAASASPCLSAQAAVEDYIGKSDELPTADQIRAGSEDYWKLVDLINEYRGTHDLPAISLSPKLTAVATLHTRDLHEHRPHEKYGSMHSWSKSERWRGGAYDHNDKNSWPIMWDKPKELFGYGGLGFEVTVGAARDPGHALEVLGKSKMHNDVLLNRGAWRDQRWQWRALGAVIYEGFACAWFGNAADA